VSATPAPSMPTRLLSYAYRDARRHVPPGCHPGRQSRRRASALRRGIRLAGWILGAIIVVLGLAGTADVLLAVLGTPWQLTGSSWLLMIGVIIGMVWGAARWWRQDAENRNAPRLAALLRIDDVDLVRGRNLRVMLDSAGETLPEVGLLVTEYYDIPLNIRGRIDRKGGAVSICTTRSHILFERWQPFLTDLTSLLSIPPQLPPSYEGAHLSIAWSVALRNGRNEQWLQQLPIWVRP
jgi:hypothetical protein